MRKIIISGGDGSFAKALIDNNKDYELYPLSRNEMNVTNMNDIVDNIQRISPDIFIHAAALTRPMKTHNEFPELSIRSNIIGTGNVTLACMEMGIKLIYISTDYVYPGNAGNYKESDSLFPVNNYAWSKLGGECAVRMYPNSLILRMGMCETPYPHEGAIVNAKKSMITSQDSAKLVFRLLDQIGIINVGGESICIYDFVKKLNPKIKKIYLENIDGVDMAKDCSMNCDKLKDCLNDTPF